jgi:hypothetical protein
MIKQPVTVEKSSSIALWVIAGLVALGIIIALVLYNYDAKQREICNDTNTVIQNGEDAGIDSDLQPRDCG